MEAVVVGQDAEYVSAEDAGEFKLVAGTVDELLVWDPEHLASAFNLGVVPHEEVGIVD